MRFLWKLIKILLPTIILLPIISLFLYKYYNPIITITQINEAIHYNKLDREYISYDDMGDNIKLAVIASEDQTMRKGKNFVAVAQYPNKLLKIFSFGKDDHGFARD